MIGDAQDMQARIRLTLPARWFADTAPVLDGLLSGLAAAWAWLYQFVLFVVGQSRISTATADFLDMAAQDFFGGGFARRANESDDQFRPRLLAAMQRTHATRASLVAAAAAAGYSITIFEAAQPGDTGAYNIGSTLAWGSSGAWGSLEMPFECLVTATAGPAPYSAELQADLGRSMPAGGAAWLRITG